MCTAASVQAGQGGAAGAIAPGDETRATHILSPGDAATWPLKAKEGEVIIARVSSGAFDPAVEVVDASGKVLGQNDDIRPGVQEALVLVRLPAAGDYKVLVKAYKGGSGGQYSVHFNRFVPQDAVLSTRNSGTSGQNRYKWLRFPATKGETLSVAAFSASGIQVQLVNPTGDEQTMEPLGNIPGGSRNAFRAEYTGDHYLRLTGPSGFSYAATISPARTATIAQGAVKPAKLDVGGLDIWTFEAKAGDLVRVYGLAKGAKIVTDVIVPPSETEDVGMMESEEPMVPISSAAKSGSDETILIRRDGRFEVRVYQPLSLSAEYELSISPVTARLDREVSGRLNVGSMDVFGFEGKAGEVIDLTAMAPTFDASLILFSPYGQPVMNNDDGAGDKNSRIVYALPETGRYLVGITSYGRGGSGEYQLTRKPATVRPLAKAAKGESALGAGTADIWSFSGKTGQVLVISAQSEEMDVSIDILAPDGSVVARGLDEVGTNALASFELPLDGTYTIWVRGSGSGRYTVRWLDLNDETP